MANKYKEDKINPGVFLPNEELSDDDLDWTEEEIKLFSRLIIALL